jgi:hypothetical protein
VAPSDGCSVARRSLSFNKSAAFQVRRSSGGSDHADRYARINIYQIRGRDLSPAASTEAPPGDLTWISLVSISAVRLVLVDPQPADPRAVYGRKVAINVRSRPHAVTKRRFCHFVSLSARRAAGGGVARDGHGQRRDSRLSRRLIRCNFAKGASGLRFRRTQAAPERLWQRGVDHRSE